MRAKPAKKVAAKKVAARKIAARKVAAKKVAAKKAASARRSPERKILKAVGPAKWSSEGGWEQRIAGSKIKERPGRPLGVLREDPIAEIRKVAETIDQANAKTISKRNLDFRLATSWAAAVCAGLGWENVELRDPEGRMRWNVLVDPERRWYVDPHALVRRLLGLDGTGWCGDNTAVLLYGMMAEKKLPPSRPGQYLAIG